MAQQIARTGYFLRARTKPTTATIAPTTVPMICLLPKAAEPPAPIRSAARDRTKTIIPSTSKTTPAIFLPPILSSPFVTSLRAQLKRRPETHDSLTPFRQTRSPLSGWRSCRKREQPYDRPRTCLGLRIKSRSRFPLVLLSPQSARRSCSLRSGRPDSGLEGARRETQEQTL